MFGKKTYAMIPINSKINGKDEVLIRRVLISYKGKPIQGVFGGKTYINTRLVAKDPYFKDEKSSHQYIFFDDGYYLEECKHADLKEDYEGVGIMHKVRPYHTTFKLDNYFKDGDELKSIEFKAKNDKEAAKIFEGRKELR